MKAFWSLISVIVVVLTIAWYLTTYVFITEEERILRVIEKAKLSVESGSVISLSGVLSADYSHAGGMDRAMVLRLMTQFFGDTEDRQIRLGAVNIEIQTESRANADVSFFFDAILTNPNSAARQYISENQNQKKQVTIDLSKDNGSWKITRTSRVSG